MTILRRAFCKMRAAFTFLCALPLLATAPAGEAIASQASSMVPLSGDFDLFVGGAKAAELRIEGSISDGRYRAAAKITTAGVVGTFYTASIDARVEGSVAGGAPGAAELSPERFNSVSLNPRKDRRVEMRYAAGAPTVLAEPAYSEKPWQLEPGEQRGLLDPVTALMAGLSPGPRQALCDRHIDIFDARRHYAVTFKPAGEPDAEGEIVCEAEYRRVAGYKPKMLAKPPFPFTAVFRQRPDGLWALERVMGETPIGAAVLRRRKG
ncbi:MAG: DUF3108 domain-containing protein [Pseudomonadota bacterium]